jgi:tetratricopeptide (TPR) repeat protein
MTMPRCEGAAPVNHASILVLAVVLAAASASAQPGDSGAAAEAALQEGRRLYDLQEWDSAIVKFKEAYRLRADAAALFNIAQSYRLKGDCASAASFYKTYRRNFPNEGNIDRVDRFITEMEACAKTAPKPEKPEPGTPGPVTPDPVTPDPATPDPAMSDPVTPGPADPSPGPEPIVSPGSSGSPGKGMRLAGLGVAALGVVSIGASVRFGLSARSAAREAEALAPGSPWDPGIDERGDRAATRAVVFATIGSAAIVAGGVLYVLGVQQRTERGGVTVVPAPGGATLGWATVF